MGFFPAEVVGRDTRHALAALGFTRRAHDIGHDKDRGLDVLRHHVVAQGHAARDLDVHQLVQRVGLDALRIGIGRHQPQCHVGPLGVCHRVGDAQLGQAAVEPRHVLGKAKGLAGVDGHHLIDAVAKNEASIHHADLGLGEFSELAVEVAGQRGQTVHDRIIAAHKARMVLTTPASAVRILRQRLGA